MGSTAQHLGGGAAASVPPRGMQGAPATPTLSVIHQYHQCHHTPPESPGGCSGADCSLPKATSRVLVWMAEEDCPSVCRLLSHSHRGVKTENGKPGHMSLRPKPPHCLEQQVICWLYRGLSSLRITGAPQDLSCLPPLIAPWGWALWPTLVIPVIWEAEQEDHKSEASLSNLASATW